MMKPCLKPFHSCLSSTRTAATKGRVQAAAQYTMARVNIEIVKRSDGLEEFVILPKRWLVEKVFRVAQSLSPIGKAGVSQPSPRIPTARLNPAHAAKAMHSKRDVRGRTSGSGVKSWYWNSSE